MSSDRESKSISRRSFIAISITSLASLLTSHQLAQASDINLKLKESSMTSGPFESSLGSLPKWDLSDLYPSMDHPKFNADISLLLSSSKNFRDENKDTLQELLRSKNAQKLASIIEQYDSIADLLHRLGAFAFLLRSQDNLDPKRAKFFSDTHDSLAQASSLLVFFTLEINLLDQELLIELCDSDANLNRYRPWIKNISITKPHQLSEEIERLFVEKSTSSYESWVRLFDETIAGLRFTVNDQELSIEPTLKLLSSNDRNKRHAAYSALSNVFNANTKNFALITNVLAKDKEINDRWHKFQDIADSRHLDNHLEAQVVETMVETVQQAYPRLFHRYYKIKAKWLRLPILESWDRNAPLPEESDDIIPWETAKQTVLDAYNEFSPELYKLARNFFDNPWIDAESLPGKAPGAFSYPASTSMHPYILLNYLGKKYDTMVLAHELGHGVHQMLAIHNGTLMSETPLSFAETASVFGEMLTFKKLLKESTNHTTKKLILSSQIENTLNTIVRQISFYDFERKVHLARKDGELSTETLNSFWLTTQRQSLGPAINLPDEYGAFWSSIPHFIHAPFYVYAYAFGACLVYSLYATYEQDPKQFPPKYLDLLRAAGTKHHKELLAPFGLDASKPECWSMGIKIIENMIDEAEGLN